MDIVHFSNLENCFIIDAVDKTFARNGAFCVMMIWIAHHVATVIELISVLIISWGVLWALGSLARMAFEKLHGDFDVSYSWLRLRRTFGEYLLLGLQFLVAADIILTICNPDPMTVGLLAAIVLIRVILSVSLGKEIRELQEREMDAHHTKHGPECN